MFTSQLNRNQEWGLLALRLAVAAIFLYHGSQKWGMWTAAPEGMDGTLLWLMRILAIAEPLGGLAMVVGFLTRWAALGLSIIMVGTIYTKMVTMGVGFVTPQGPGWEFDLIILGGCLSLLFTGPGKLSVDAVMKME